MSTSKALTISTLFMGLCAHSTMHPTFTTFVPGLVSTEMPQLLIYIQILIAWRQSRKSGLTSLYVKVLHLMNLGSFLVLAERWVNQLKDAATDYEQALAKSNIPQKKADLFSVLRKTAFPIDDFKSVRIERNIPYTDGAVIDPELTKKWSESLFFRASIVGMGRGTVPLWHTLDIIKGTNFVETGPLKPVFMYIHGGGWSFCDKSYASLPWLLNLANSNIVVVTVNYRMAPEAPLPAAVYDLKRALIWIKANIERYGGDPAQVFIGGESAGGHMSSLLACTPNISELQPPEDLCSDTSVKGCVAHCGIYDWVDEKNFYGNLHASFLRDPSRNFHVFLQERIIQKPLNSETRPFFETLSPYYQLKRIVDSKRSGRARAIPPFFVAHGTEDAVTSFRDSEQFIDMLQQVRDLDTRENKVKDVWAPLQRAFHAPTYLVSPRSLALARATADFIHFHSSREEHMSGKVL